MSKKSWKNFFMNKKAQLGVIEAQYAIGGFVVGLIIALAAVYMANKGILIPFKLTFLCP